jgi:hypothetical protein
VFGLVFQNYLLELEARPKSMHYEIKISGSPMPEGNYKNKAKNGAKFLLTISQLSLRNKIESEHPNTVNIRNPDAR